MAYLTRAPLQWKTLRDGILFFAGLAGVFHQTVLAPSPNEALLVLFAAMMGLPAFLRSDEGRNATVGKDTK